MQDLEHFIRGFARFQQRLMDEPIARAGQQPPAPRRARPARERAAQRPATPSGSTA